MATLKEILNRYRFHKLSCGDLRGMKNKFSLAADMGVNQMKIYFNSMGGKDRTDRFNGRVEIQAEICESENSNGWTVYTMKELKKELQKIDRPQYITFYCVNYNKYQTDSDTKTLETIIYN